MPEHDGLADVHVLERAEAIHIALAFAVNAGSRAEVEEQMLELRGGIDAQVDALRLQRLDGLDIGLGQVDHQVHVAGLEGGQAGLRIGHELDVDRIELWLCCRSSWGCGTRVM